MLPHVLTQIPPHIAPFHTKLLHHEIHSHQIEPPAIYAAPKLAASCGLMAFAHAAWLMFEQTDMPS